MKYMWFPFSLGVFLTNSISLYIETSPAKASSSLSLWSQIAAATKTQPQKYPGQILRKHNSTRNENLRRDRADYTINWKYFYDSI